MIKRKFKNYFLKPFQFRQSIFVIWVVIVTLLASVLVMYNLSVNLFIENLSNDNVDYKSVISTLNIELFKYLGVLGLCLCMVSFLLSIMISHRVAGPLYKIELYLKKMSKGSIPSKISFRDDDFKSSVPDNFNEFIDYLRKYKHKAEDLEALLEKIPFVQESDKQLVFDKIKDVKNHFSEE